MVCKTLHDHLYSDTYCGLIPCPLPYLTLLLPLASLLFLEHIKYALTSGPLNMLFTLLAALSEYHMVLSLTSLMSLLKYHFIRWAFLVSLFKIASYPFDTPIFPVLLSSYILFHSSFHFLSYYIFIIACVYHTHTHTHTRI